MSNGKEQVVVVPLIVAFLILGLVVAAARFGADSRSEEPEWRPGVRLL